MRIQTTLHPIAAENGSAVALGYFDGVHIGHRTVLNTAVQYAKQHSLDSAVFTFSLNNSVKGRAILPLNEKFSRISKLGINHCICPDFALFHNFTPIEFADRILVQAFNAKAVFCGDNFTFGAQKSGNTALLAALCKERGITLNIVPMAYLSSEAVSSTGIRACLEAGNISKVNEMLAQPYAINYEVVHGKGLGKTLGVPTLNQIYPAGMLVPKHGVYITRVLIQGVYYNAATGIGSRPTVNGTDVTCESFVEGLCEDVYGDNVRLEFYQYLYETKKYENLTALKEMIIRASQSSDEFFSQK